jgi:hypothetical protein
VEVVKGKVMDPEWRVCVLTDWHGDDVGGGGKVNALSGAIDVELVCANKVVTDNAGTPQVRDNIGSVPSSGILKSKREA